MKKIELSKHWKPEDIEYLGQKSPILRKRSNCLVPDWKILIRKYFFSENFHNFNPY